MKKIIRNVSIVTDGKIISGKSVVFENGKIISLIDGNNFSHEEFEEIIDGKGKFLSPGFIDIHLHGGGGYDFMDGTEESYMGALKSHLMHGTTACVPTLLCGPEYELQNAEMMLSKIRSLCGSILPSVPGFHLEGPFISKEMAGAQDPKYISDADEEKIKNIYEIFSSDLLIWTMAPEISGVISCSDFLKSKGVILSVGHTNAEFDDCMNAIANGFSMATHLYSSMSTIIRKNGYRVPGAIEASLLSDDISAEVISDGKHLPESLLKLIYKIKGRERICLVTDAMRGAGMPDGDYMLGSLSKGQMVKVFDGIAHMPDGISFAGSVATADRLVRVMHKNAGIPLEDCIMMITENPAKEIGIFDSKGSISPGKDADFVLFDENIEVSEVYLSGNKICF